MMTACGQTTQAPEGATASPSTTSSPAISPRYAAHAASAPMRVEALRPDGSQVALRVFMPAGGDCAPLALISPGAGSGDDPAVLGYLGAALQRNGWQAIVLRHKEGGRESLRERIRNGGMRDGLLALTTDPSAYRDRFADIGAALAWSRARCKPPFTALIGHSMGAATVMLEAGATDKLGVDGEDRFDAYVALSPQGPGAVFPEHAWAGIAKPLLLLTGTRDATVEGPWKTRTLPYDDLPAGCHWLGIVDNANHLNFAGFGYGHEGVEAIVVPTVLTFLADARRHACPPPASLPRLTLKTK